MKPWLILVIELLLLAGIIRLVKGKPWERIAMIILTIVTIGVEFLVVWLGIVDGYVFRPNFLMVSLICLLRLGDLWKKTK